MPFIFSCSSIRLAVQVSRAFVAGPAGRSGLVGRAGLFGLSCPAFQARFLTVALTSFRHLQAEEAKAEYANILGQVFGRTQAWDED